ncbi:MAG TPA: HlyD family efflux transporter periplasmic adaptor subunit [bacterium]|nr:HlyD family efflux transporter periplasmic adaptor subunit [bacterium]
MAKRTFQVIIGGVVLGALVAGAWVLGQRVRAQRPDGVLFVSGRIEGEEILISSKIGGRLRQLLVREGDRVDRGQLVAVLSSEELDARMRQAEAQVSVARAQVLQAEAGLSAARHQVAQALTAVDVSRVESGSGINQAEAGVAAARAQVTQAQAAVRRSGQGVRAAQAALSKAQQDLKRLTALYDQGAVSAMEVDAARAASDGALAAHHEAEAQLQQGRAGLVQAEAVVRQAEAARTGTQAGPLVVRLREREVGGARDQFGRARALVTAARAQLAAAEAARDELRAFLGETRVFAPAAGVVISKVVNAGEVMQAGTPLAVIIDPQALWLKVFIPEPDIGRLRLGAPARVSVDGFPDRSFTATLVAISQRAEFTPKDVQTKDERVKQVFAVKLGVDNRDGALKPGMPADAQVFWKGVPAR